jgi:hypothetical protein
LWRLLTANGAKHKYVVEELGCLTGQYGDSFSFSVTVDEKKFQFERWRGIPALRDRVVAAVKQSVPEKAAGFPPWEMPLVTFAVEEERTTGSPVVVQKFVVGDVSGLVKQLESWGDKPDPKGFPIKPPAAEKNA